MSYDYLKDGTAYTAEELNQRFSKAQTDISEVTNDEMQFGALDAQHLPMLIGPASKDGKEDTHPYEQTSISEPFGLGTAFRHRDVICSISYRPGFISVDHKLKDSVSALILMFNCNVEFFTEGETPEEIEETMWRDYKIEDLLFATFRVRVTNNRGESFFLSKAARSISPGWSLGGSIRFPSASYDERGKAFEPDTRSDKDVSIRTVILPSDLDPYGERKVAQIEIVLLLNWYLYNKSDLPDQDALAIRISKANLTCLPIQAKVVT